MLKDREILIAVSGGIAAYKTAVLVSRLVRAGARVSVMMTAAATELVGPKTFEALTRRPVRLDLWHDASAIPHIDAAQKAELLCVAPATANLLAKAASGIADDLVSTTILAFDGPALFAPAMNRVMWNKPATKRNVERLTADGVYFVGPESGRLCCGDDGDGRMAEPEEIFAEIERLLSGEARNQR